jgi:hypothetical protein
MLRRAAAEIRENCPIPEVSRGLDFIDYPAAWAIQKVGDVAHDERCSATQTGGAMLCDCEALCQPWRHWRTLLAVADWLEAEASRHEVLSVDFDVSNCCRMPQALAVARAYLGEDQ